MVTHRLLLTLALALALPAPAAGALPFAQDWSDVGLIAVDHDWSGVPGIVGYRGDDLTAADGVDPQTVLADGSATPVHVLADRTSPSSLFTGGLAEFELANPAVALQGSATADAPHLVVALDTTGWAAVTVSYVLRDLDASGDDAAQAVALQYRIGSSGEFVNVPEGFVADATTGPGLAELETSVEAVLPAEAAGRPLVELRVLTTNAAGSDEWVGVDDIAVSGTATDETPPGLSVAVARQSLGRALRRGIRSLVGADEPCSLRSEILLRPRLARRLGLPRRVGQARTALAEAGTARLATPFSRRAKRKLAALGSVRLTLRTTAVDATGNTAVTMRRLRLVR